MIQLSSGFIISRVICVDERNGIALCHLSGDSMPKNIPFTQFTGFELNALRMDAETHIDENGESNTQEEELKLKDAAKSDESEVTVPPGTYTSQELTEQLNHVLKRDATIEPQKRQRRSSLSPELQAMADIEAAYEKHQCRMEKADDELMATTGSILVQLDDATRARVNKWEAEKFGLRNPSRDPGAGGNAV
jgi:hypothetical protein